MRLAALHSQFTVVRDGEFKTLGASFHREEDMLVYVDDEKHVVEVLGNPCVSCVLTTPELADRFPSGGVATSALPDDTFYALHDQLGKAGFYGGREETVFGRCMDVSRAAYVADWNVVLQDGVTIEPRAVILPGSVIEEGATIRAGAVIGSEGFKVRRWGPGIPPRMVPHFGYVRIGPYVEIQSNCSVNKNIFGGYTEVGADTKVNNLVHIAHNVKIGQRVLIGGGAKLCGAAVVGDDVWIGPGAVVTRVMVGDRAKVMAGAVVTKDVLNDTKVTGNFAIPHERFIAFMKSIK